MRAGRGPGTSGSALSLVAVGSGRAEACPQPPWCGVRRRGEDPPRPDCVTRAGVMPVRSDSLVHSGGHLAQVPAPGAESLAPAKRRLKPPHLLDVAQGSLVLAQLLQ